ncbi:ABC transporter permease [Brevibacillus sp. NRS-1366]|uniref:ABC transporter permease n=1 Tax=Brevibacillus sp. NRS-1366 TaxID=3233899 RepID=UPI003D1D2902
MIKTQNEVGVRLNSVSLSYKLTRLPGLQWLLPIIPLAYILFLMVFSMISLFKLSISNEDGFTFEYVTHLFTHTVYLEVLWLTIKTAFLVTAFALLLAYPIAYLLVRIESATWKKLILGAVLIPFWISLLARSYSWMILLQEQGVINKILLGLGMIDQPLSLMYNTFGVIIGMTHVLLPYMVLSLYSVMEGIDQSLVRAAEGMGARPWKAFLQVFFPLSLPGILSGALLVFVLAIGFYVTPALLGGPNNMMISMLIQENVTTTLNWHLASALSLVLFVVTLLLLSLSLLLTRNNPLLKEDH